VKTGWIRKLEPRPGGTPSWRSLQGAEEGLAPESGRRAAAAWRTLAVWVGVMLFLSLVVFGWWRGTVGVRESRRELAALMTRKQQLADTNRDLARQVKALQGEKEARARAARESLDVASPDETVVIVPPTPPAR
jgi:cell division protein FtsB